MGGKFGEMSTLMNYTFQSFNYRDRKSIRPFYDLIANIAAARGVTLHEVESRIEGDINLLGIFGMSKDVRNGYQGIRASFSIKGDASAFLSDFTLTSVSKIEVLRGSGSSLYGTNAIGGTIEVWGDGLQTRSFMHVDDCVEGLYRIMQSD